MDDEIRRNGGFILGTGLIVLGVVDAISNPFDPITPIELITAGGTLIVTSMRGKGKK